MLYSFSTMGLKSVKFLGILVTTSSKKDILKEIRKYLGKRTPDGGQPAENLKKTFTIVTPNPEQIVYAQKDKHFVDILNQADVAIPDGIGLALAGRFLNVQYPISNDQIKLKRIPGVEFMEGLVRLAAKDGYRIGLIGGRDGVAVKALECLQKRYPGLVGWAMEPEGKSIEEIVRKIADTDTRLVFVGLGAPKQEYFIEKLQAPVVAMSVGGSFDIIAGKTPRAPFLLRTIGVEWLWRLVREPWRWRRQLALFKFLWLVLRKNNYPENSQAW